MHTSLFFFFSRSFSSFANGFNVCLISKGSISSFSIILLTAVSLYVTHLQVTDDAMSSAARLQVSLAPYFVDCCPFLSFSLSGD